MSMHISNDQPVYAVAENTLVRVINHLIHMSPIPPSRMFLINKSLKVYSQNKPGSPVFDASQGDGGASLPGVPREILERAVELQIAHGSAYDMRHLIPSIDPYYQALCEFGSALVDKNPRA